MDSIHSSKSQQMEELGKKSEMKLHPKSMHVTGSGGWEPVILLAPTRCTASLQRERSCRAPDMTGFGSKPFYVSGSLIQQSILDFIFSLRLCYLLKHHGSSGITRLLERTGPFVIGSCINCGLNFIEFTQVLCWIVSKH